MQGPMVVAVRTVGVVQMAFHKIVDVVTVGYRPMAAFRAVYVPAEMRATLVARGAAIGIGIADIYCMVVDMVAMHIMQMPLVQIVGVPIVFDRDVSAPRPVYMIMPFMNFAFRGRRLLLLAHWCTIPPFLAIRGGQATRPSAPGIILQNRGKDG